MLPGADYNKRLRKAAEMLRRVTRLRATDTSVWSDDVWNTEAVHRAA